MADGGISALTIASLALTAVGTGATIYAGMEQSAAQEDAIKKSSEFNAQRAENDAKAATDQAAYDASLVRERGRRLAGQQAAAAGKSGVTLDGSVGDVQMDSAFSNELDALASEYQGSVAANRFKSDAAMGRMSAGNSISVLKAGQGASMAGTLLSGLGKSAGYASDMYKTSPRPASIKAEQVYPSFN